jgi:hypothetical protein
MSDDIDKLRSQQNSSEDACSNASNLENERDTGRTTSGKQIMPKLINIINIINRLNGRKIDPFRSTSDMDPIIEDHVLDVRDRILKVAYRLTFGIISRTVGIWDERYRWLSHYLLGHCEPLHLPEQLITKELYKEDAIDLGKEGIPYTFYSRTKVFWIVGTMSFSLHTNERGRIELFGKDRYDWHRNRLVCSKCGCTLNQEMVDEDGLSTCCGATIDKDWWWSPTSLPGWLAKLSWFIWPLTRYYLDIGKSGRLSISNGLWPLLARGREFDTIVAIEIDRFQKSPFN